MSITLVSKSRSEVDREFRSLGELLRWLAAEQAWNLGERSGTSPRDLYVGTRYRNGTFSPVHAAFFPWEIDPDLFGRLHDLQARYRKWVHYLTEVYPQWTDIETIPYMDNSVEVRQEDRWGNTRQVQTVAPHGDLC